MTAGAGALLMDGTENGVSGSVVWGALALGVAAVVVKDLLLPTAGHLIVNYKAQDSLTQFERAASHLSGDLTPDVSVQSMLETEAIYYVMVDDRIVGKMPTHVNGGAIVPVPQITVEFAKLKSAVSNSVWSSRNAAPTVCIRCDDGRLSKDYDIVQSDLVHGRVWTSVKNGLNGIWNMMNTPLAAYESYMPMAKTAPAVPNSGNFLASNTSQVSKQNL